MPLILPVRMDSAIGANRREQANPGRCGLLLPGDSVHLFVSLVLPGGGFRARFGDTGRQTGHFSRDVLFLGKAVLLFLSFYVPIWYRAAGCSVRSFGRCNRTNELRAILRAISTKPLFL